ncbi:MAG: hypothetical protein Q8O32_03895 [bacterium]|nr:hypothetical protein [bacterium]
MDIYKFVGILGLVIISVGVFWQKKYLEYILYIIGGLALLVYSYSIGDWIFIILQVVFTISATSHLLRSLKFKKN